MVLTYLINVLRTIDKYFPKVELQTASDGTTLKLQHSAPLNRRELCHILSSGISVLRRGCDERCGLHSSRLLSERSLVRLP